MPYRVLVTNIPLHVGEEEFYDYVRAHVSGEAVVNALLVMRPDSTGKLSYMSSSGAALVDYATKSAADAARRVDFYVDGVAVMMKAVGSVVLSGRSAEAVANEGREAYRKLQCGVSHSNLSDGHTDATPGHKRQREVNDIGSSNNDDKKEGKERDEEVELRLVGIPCDVYGSFFVDGVATREFPQTRRSAVDLFTDVARSVSRATLGELLSLRRISDDEAIIRVLSDTADALLERAADGLRLEICLATDDARERSEHSRNRCAFTVCQPRPHIRITEDNFTLATKHEVLEAMARMMAITNAKVAGFIDPFGNLLLPSVS